LGTLRDNLTANKDLGGLVKNGNASTAIISGHIEPRDRKGQPLGSASLIDNKISHFLEHEDPEDSASAVNDTGFDVDTVSGAVILRGEAYDDQRIRLIQIQTGATVTPILIWDETTGELKRASHPNPPEDPPVARDFNANEAGFYERLNLDGHFVVWAYKWDTPQAIGNVVVRVIAKDVLAGAVDDAHTSIEKRNNIGGTDTNGATNNGYEIFTNTNVGDDPANLAALGSTEGYNSINVDIAPYIRTLTRYTTAAEDATPAEALRSKNGWFSFRRSRGAVEGENERFDVEGFNLWDGTNASTIAINGALVTAGTQYNNTTAVTVTPSKTKLESYIPRAAITGIVTVKAGASTVEAVNNLNNNLNSWNYSQERLSGDAAAYWTDDRKVHLFDSHNIGRGNDAATDEYDEGYFRTPATIGAPKRPQMTIDPATGILYAGFSTYVINTTATNFTPYYSSNNGNGAAGYDEVARNDPHEDVAVTWDTTSTGTRPIMLYYDNYNASGAFYGGLRYANAAGTGSWVTNSNNNANRMIDQFSYLNTVNNGARNYSSWYDIKHGLGFATTSSAYTGITGNANGNNGPGNTQPAYATQGYLLVESPTDGAAGKYNAVDYVKTGADAGNPVVVYQYVTAAGTESVRYAYAPAPTSTNLTTGANVGTWNNSAARYILWTANIDGTYVASGATIGQHFAAATGGTGTNITAPAAGILTIAAGYKPNGNNRISATRPAGAAELTLATVMSIPAAGDWTISGIDDTTNGGRYLSMKIDNNNDMHIAYMNSESGDLIYLKGTRDSSDGSYDFTSGPVTIDSVGNVGKWTDMAIDADGNPVISYFDQAGIDSKNGFKMAIYNSSFGGNHWEYATLPGRYAVEDVRSQVVCDTNNTRYWNAAFAYVSGNYYRISYYVK
jgi:hypothetical protein